MKPENGSAFIASNELPLSREWRMGSSRISYASERRSSGCSGR
jgi:hypothetical protein